MIGLMWSAGTIALYLATRQLHRRRPCWWLSPIVLTPCGLTLAAVGLHVSYDEYYRGTHWLGLLLGPATIAFAIPIYEQRAVIRRHWPVLVAGVVMGSGTAMVSAWALASILNLSDSLRLSLVPRSFSTPFAMSVSGTIGGVPEMTAVFVIITGIVGAIVGEGLLVWLPLRTTLAKGALFGMGAHAVGTAKALGRGREEGSIAGIVMILVGVLNVLAAPLISAVLP